MTSLLTLSVHAEVCNPNPHCPNFLVGAPSLGESYATAKQQKRYQTTKDKKKVPSYHNSRMDAFMI